MEECKYGQKRIKIEKLIDEDLEKNKSNSDSNDETKSDIDNDKYDKQILKKHFNNNKSPIVCVNHTCVSVCLNDINIRI